LSGGGGNEINLIEVIVLAERGPDIPSAMSMKGPSSDEGAAPSIRSARVAGSVAARPNVTR